jgi:protein SCO1/2
MRRTMLWISLGLLAGFLLAAGMSLGRPYELRGSTIQQPFAAPDFSLPGGRGGQFRLSDQQGRLVLVFFGYTSCPDVCPTTLADMKQIRQHLGDDAKDVEFVFITVDPERDLPEKVHQYVTAFDPAFVGLSGAEEQLAPVWKAYGVYHQSNKESPQDQQYEVEHSSQVYLVDRAGNLRLTYAFGTPVDDILQDLRYLLKQKG